MAGAGCPVPLKATLTVGWFGSELATARLPVAAPETVGWNVTGTLIEFDGVICAGKDGAPLPREKPVPVTVSAVTLQFAVPVF